MRLFTAIELSQEAIAELRRVQAALRETLSGGRWAPAENFHLTLHFLGEVHDDRLAELDSLLASLVEGEGPFELALGPLGVFPRHGTARVLWAGLADEEGRLGRLEEKLRQGMLSLSLLRPDGRYSPHVTLAREPRAHERLRERVRSIEVRPVSWRVERIALFRSVLKPTGSVYSVVNAYSLK